MGIWENEKSETNTNLNIGKSEIQYSGILKGVELEPLSYEDKEQLIISEYDNYHKRKNKLKALGMNYRNLNLQIMFWQRRYEAEKRINNEHEYQRGRELIRLYGNNKVAFKEIIKEEVKGITEMCPKCNNPMYQVNKKLWAFEKSDEHKILWACPDCDKRGLEIHLNQLKSILIEKRNKR
ncbi:MAG: hypothetical protein ACYCS1_05465 [Gammaproteobacteria bacterium]